MTTSSSSPLRRIVLHAARSKDFPEGSTRHGYEFVAPLTEAGRIDLDAWKAHRGLCVVHRFWGEELPMRGQLVHRAGGTGGATWAFDYGPQHSTDSEAGYRFGDHAFRVGEYVSIREADGELMTFNVIHVGRA